MSIETTTTVSTLPNSLTKSRPILIPNFNILYRDYLHREHHPHNSLNYEFLVELDYLVNESRPNNFFDSFDSLYALKEKYGDIGNMIIIEGHFNEETGFYRARKAFKCCCIVEIFQERFGDDVFYYNYDKLFDDKFVF